MWSVGEKADQTQLPIRGEGIGGGGLIANYGLH